MFFRKMFYVFFGCVMGFMAANFIFVPNSMAQLGLKDSGFAVTEMEGMVPASYGKLIAVSGLYLYFQGDDGTIYIVTQHTSKQFDPNVTVIKRS